MKNKEEGLLQVRWPHISLGYVGRVSETATLNSRFFYNVLNSLSVLDSPLIFPQRVPKVDYFKELIALELKCFEDEFLNITKKLQNLVSVSHQTNNLLLNSLKLLMRYGGSQFVIDFSCRHNLSDDIALQMDFLKICSNIQVDLSKGSKPDLYPLSKFTDKVIVSYHCSINFKIIVLNRLIVNYFRYKLEGNIYIPIDKFVNNLLVSLKKIDGRVKSNRLLIAYSYRGVSMSNTLSEEEKRWFLLTSEKLSRGLHSENIIENVVYQENLYTTLQTLAKYAINTGNPDHATNYLKEMIYLDPFDPTAYSELALLLLEQGHYAESALYFEKSKLLGPPGVGMNIYYEAKCYESLGDVERYISLLKESSVIDPYAISPKLDLLEHYMNINFHEKVIEISHEIIHDDVLFSQLTVDEKKAILENANKIGC